MKLFFTVDLEDWYHAHDYNIPMELWDGQQSRLEANTHKLLTLMDQYQVKAIFFVLGYIANRHPELIKEISAKGHVIGSHGFNHEKLYQIDKECFRSDLKRSLKLLESLTGKKATCFRAPSWTIDHRSDYLYEVLSDEGVLVDSSLQPFKTPLSGVSKSLRYPHFPEIKHKKSRVLEFPVQICKFGPLKIPFSGGFYFRVLPYWLIEYCFRESLKRSDCFLYIHPWEIDSEQPKPSVPIYIWFIHNFGIRGTLRKLEKIFTKFKFVDPNEFGVGYGEYANGKAAH